jgi:hypothetical protein
MLQSVKRKCHVRSFLLDACGEIGGTVASLDQGYIVTLIRWPCLALAIPAMLADEGEYPSDRAVPVVHQSPRAG